MANTLRSWTMPTNAVRLKAVRLARKYLREGYGPAKSRKMASKEVGYSVASIYQWEKQFPLKGKVRTTPVKRTTTTIHSHKHPTKTTTESTPINGIVIDRNLGTITKNQLRVLSVDLMTDNGQIVTLTERSLRDIVKMFG